MVVKTKLIQMAAKMYEARDAIKVVWGSEFNKKIEIWKELIRLRMSILQTNNEVEAVIAMLKEAKGKPDDGIFSILILAALVEMIEPEVQ
jgi:hypothetical protein